MKKLLLVLLLVGVLLFTGCVKAVTTAQLDKVAADLGARIEAIRGEIDAEDYGGRLEAIEQDLEDLRIDLEDVSTPDLSNYATQANLQSALNNFIANLTPVQITALKEALGMTGTTPPVPPSGEVAVVLDVDAKPYQFTSYTTPTGQIFPVKITNGTDEYQTVSFNILFQCVSADGQAEVIPDLDKLCSTFVVLDLSMTVSTVALVPTPVSSYCACQWIYFTWTADTILVAPNKEVTVYANLSNFQTADDAGAGVYELWEVTLTGITVNEL